MKRLTASQEAQVLAGARTVSDEWRDGYFERVAEALRYLLRITDEDVDRAVKKSARVYRDRAEP